MIGVGDFKSTDEIENLVVVALRSGRVSYGPLCKELEDVFAEIHGARYGIVTNSGTDALRVALHAMKIIHGWPDGMEVLVPAVTFVATVNIVLQVGLKPVLVDVLPNCNIHPEKAAAAVTDKTVAAIPVHLFGNPADMTSLVDVLPPDVLLIEDACEAAFAKHRGQFVGGLGEIGCFSFYAAHHVVAGVGGIAITNDPKYADVMRSLVNHGRSTQYISMDDIDPSNIGARFRFEHIGYSCRMMELQAALALPQVREWREAVETRERNVAILRGIAERLGITHVQPHPSDRPSWMMFPLFHRRKWELMAHLERNGIETRETLPLTNQPCYASWVNPDDFLVADQINHTGLYIPCHQYLTTYDLRKIGVALERFFEEQS